MSDAPAGSAPARTLALAAKTLGGAQALAAQLSAESAALERWMAGEELPPYEVFLKALDIVAAGPRVDPAARRASARRAPSHADRLQTAASRVQPKDGAPASNRPAGEKDKAKG